MFCKNCGQQLADDTRFCPCCGTRVEEKPEGKPAQFENTPVTPEGSGDECIPACSPSVEACGQTADPKKEKIKSVLNKTFIGGLISGAFGVILFIGIVLVSLIGWGEVYLFGGYDFVKVLAIISIVFMLLGFVITLPLFIINFKTKSINALKSNKILILCIILLALCIGLSVWGFIDADDNRYSYSGSGSANSTTLYDAYYGNNCSYPYATYGGSYIKIDTNPYDYDSDESGATQYSSTALAKIIGINNTLGFPSYVYQEMVSTRALDGTQSYHGTRFSASWKYHPDSGLEVIYKSN